MTDPSDDPEGPPEAPLRRSEARRPSADPAAEFTTHLRAARSEFEQQVERARADFDVANEKIKERTGRDLIVATLIGLALGVVVIGSLMFFKEIFL
ncbi:phosphatidate cytidylyltransferase, partial [Microbacterium sp. zg.Y909]|nr:phosphatidate cytidylyltransferase [Microbacterium sp. zg.Y909]